MRSEEMGHGAVGLYSVTELGLRREEVEEREERLRREGMRVVIDEVDHMIGCEGWDES